MNAQQFNEAIKEWGNACPVDVKLVGKWFDAILQNLKTLHLQKSGIKHPRHRGDAREEDFVNAIKPIIPAGIRLSKGYAVNRNASYSREQDVLMLDASTSGALLDTNGIQYFPVESILASIEVKSRLNLEDILKSIINWLSIKNVSILNPERDNKETGSCGTLWHAIFAYESDMTLERLAEVFNRETGQA